MNKTISFGFISNKDDLKCKKIELKKQSKTFVFLFKSHQPSTSKKTLSKLFLQTHHLLTQQMGF